MHNRPDLYACFPCITRVYAESHPTADPAPPFEDFTQFEGIIRERVGLLASTAHPDLPLAYVECGALQVLIGIAYLFFERPAAANSYRADLEECWVNGALDTGAIQLFTQRIHNCQYFSQSISVPPTEPTRRAGLPQNRH